MERDSIRRSVRSALEMATIPDLDKVMERLEHGLNEDDVLQYTMDLTSRADDLLEKLMQDADEIASKSVADDTKRETLTRASVTALLDDMYPAQ